MTVRDAFLQALTSLIGRRVFYPVNKALFLVALRGLGFNAAYGAPISHPEMRFLRRTLGRTVRTVLDVGANRGDYSRFVRTLAPDAVIHAFEPNRRTFDLLRDAASEANVQPFHAACGARPGTLKLANLADPTGSTFASLVPEVALHASHATGIPLGSPEDVPVVTLDEHCREHGLDRIDLLKIDTEGFELEVLKGAAGLIADKRIGVVQLEFNYCNVYSRVFMRDIAAALPGYGLHRLLYSGELVDLEPEHKFRELFTYHIVVAIP